MGYGTIAEEKIWRQSLCREAAYEGGDFFEVADRKGMGYYLNECGILCHLCSEVFENWQ